MLDRERQLHFFVLNQRWKQAPGAPLREGGGESGKLPKEMKKRKRAFPEKRRLLPEGHPRKISKKTKKAYYNNGKTLKFRVLNVRR